jgi:DNA-binding PadR family transcriptional regulator
LAKIWKTRKLIESNWVMDEERPRKYYKITKSGKNELEKHKKEWILMDNIFRQL